MAVNRERAGASLAGWRARVSRSRGRLLAALAAFGLATAASAAVQDRAASSADPGPDPPTVHMRIEGPLDDGTLAYLQRALRTAREVGSSRVVIELDTPGGPVELMWTLSRLIAEAIDEGIHVVAWVNDSATSAGALIAISCRSVYMRSRATIGSAQPVLDTGVGIAPIPESHREKFTSVLRARFRAVATERGRSPALAEAMVDPEVEVREVSENGLRRLITGTEWDDAVQRHSPPTLERTLCRQGELLNLTGEEAIELGIADGRAESVLEVLDKIGAGGSELLSIERSRSDELLGALTRYSFLILAAGLVLAFLEIKAPGFGLPGILSIVCFAVLFIGRYLVGLADVPHIVLAAMGVGLIVVELFVMPGTLWFGLGGAVLIIAGLILSQLGPGFAPGDPLDQAVAMDAVAGLILTAAGSLIAAWLLSRVLPRAPGVRRLVLQPAGASVADALPEAAREVREGDVGSALTDLRPVGKITLDRSGSLEFEASCSGGALARGARVRVVEVRGGRLVVESTVEEKR